MESLLASVSQNTKDLSKGFRSLKQGGRVRFEVVQGPKGQLAQNIAPIDADAADESTSATAAVPGPQA